ncbi:MAG: NUDIX domain-containing protein [Clostridia bacterium]|nr:NUDIX domain-containing protein [Clostridia bacterium]
MKQYNILVIFSPDRGRVLMCRRRKPPYAGILNFTGGKIEPGETHENAAYRELFEETAIPRDDVHLTHLIDFAYPLEHGNLCEVWCGVLRREVEAEGDENELLWVPVSDDFTDVTRFAGCGNVYHMMQYAAAHIDAITQHDN